jgi:hypothetical protein
LAPLNLFHDTFAKAWEALAAAPILCTVLTENSVGSTLQNRDEVLLGNYPAVVVDLGVTWLDSGMSPLIRPTDPILLVARYGQTKRQELASAAAGLRAANRALAGVDSA